MKGASPESNLFWARPRTVRLKTRERRDCTPGDEITEAKLELGWSLKSALAENSGRSLNSNAHRWQSLHREKYCSLRGTAMLLVNVNMLTAERRVKEAATSGNPRDGDFVTVFF
jgi:hypothetical protein